MFTSKIGFGFTDISGTPGSGIANTPTGRFAIAAGASTATITCSECVAASTVILVPKSRDATGLLPLVTTVSAGSFVATTTAVCTGNLSIDFFVIN